MNITKAIALAALTGTLAFGPQMAFADKPDGSGGAGKSDQARQNKADTSGTSRAAGSSATAAKIGAEKNTRAIDNFGRLISSIRRGDVTADELTNYAGGAPSVVDVDTLIKGNNRVALENALRGTGMTEAELRAALEANTNLTLPEGVTIEEVVYADVNADGQLVLVVDQNN
jgi:hypothetical protein